MSLPRKGISFSKPSVPAPKRGAKSSPSPTSLYGWPMVCVRPLDTLASPLVLVSRERKHIPVVY
jgi:hypothetical protein